MSHITRIGIDTSKAVFTPHCVTNRAELCCKPISAAHRWWPSFEKLPTGGLEACGSSHHWGRELSTLAMTFV